MGLRIQELVQLQGFLLCSKGRAISGHKAEQSMLNATKRERYIGEEGRERDEKG